MIEFCCKALFATRVMWRRIRTANVATDDPTRLPQFCQCPLKIDNREATALPIRYRLFHAQTIEIDCDVNIFPGQIIYKLLKALAPIVAKNRARPLPVFLRTIVCPGMHFEPAGAFGAPVPENLMWPPAFKVTATPNAHPAHVRNLQRAIHPPAAGPLRRAHIPIWMIIERNKDDCSGNAAHSKRGQMMKVARAVKQKSRGEMYLMFAIKSFDQARPC